MPTKVFCLMVSFLLLFATSTLAATPYYVTVSENAGGTVSVTYGTTTAIKPTRYPLVAGTPVTVVYTANSGYFLSSITADGASVYSAAPSDHTTYTQTFFYDGKNHRIAAKFVKDPTIVASANAGGTISPSGVVPVDYGGSTTYSITAKEGYHIAKVLINGKTPSDFSATATTPASYAYIFSGVTAKQTIRAQFAINTYSVATEVSGNGKITPSLLTGVKYGQSKTFTINPSTGMMITSLTVNGTAVSDLPPSGKYKLVTAVTQDTKIAATFSDYLPSGTARLSGSYNLVQSEYGFYQSSSVNNKFGGKNIKAIFDGKGGCSITTKGYNFYPSKSSETSQSVGSSTTDSTHPGCTYAVNDNDGAFTIKASDGTTLASGWVSRDGNSVVLGGPVAESGTGSNGTPYSTYDILQVSGVKAGSSITKSSMKGTYHLFGQMTGYYEQTSAVNEYLHGSNITVTFNGSGTCAVSNSGNEYNRSVLETSGITTEYDSGAPTCSYTVASNGIFTLKIASGGSTDTVTGWSSADGNVVIVGGATKTTRSNGAVDYEIEKTIGVKAGSDMDVTSLKGVFNLVSSNVAFLDASGSGGPSGFRAENITLNFYGTTDVTNCSVSATGASYSAQNFTSTSVNTSSDSTSTSTACHYSVDSAGAFTMNFTVGAETNSVTGYASADGMAVIVGERGSKTTDDGNYTKYFSSIVYGVKTAGYTAE